MSDIFELAKLLPNGSIHIKHDETTKLKAIIIIHNTTLGPALGGLRHLAYDDEKTALKDAFLLARSMSYKAALADIPTGGGKAVLLRPKEGFTPYEYFASFAKFVNQLGGNYITAMDSGSTQDDMEIIKQHTSYIAAYDDPAPYTALGVQRAIEAAVQINFNTTSLSGLHVAIQGVGNVGYYLAKYLFEKGCKLSIADINNNNLNKCVKQFNAKIIEPHIIHKIDCDVFSPCALGGVITKDKINDIKAKIIVGGANNQLASEDLGIILKNKGISYIPDFLANVGGLVFAYTSYSKESPEIAIAKINKIFDRSKDILKISKEANIATNLAALGIAKIKLGEKVGVEEICTI